MPRVHTAHARRFLRRSCWVILTSGEVSPQDYSAQASPNLPVAT